MLILAGSLLAILATSEDGTVSRLYAIFVWAGCLAIPAAMAYCQRTRRLLAAETEKRRQVEESLRVANLKLQCVVEEHCQITLSREAELDESQTKLVSKRRILGAVLESIGDGVVVVNREGEFTWVNSAALNLVPMLCASPKYEGDWSKGLRVVDSDGAVLKHEQMPLARAMNGERVDGAEVMVCDGDTRLRWLRVTARPLPEEKGGAVAIFHDITASKDAMSQMGVDRDQALKASRVKSEFLAVMSHELRTPLNGVRGMLEFIQAGSLDQRQAEYADVALNCSDSLLHLIDDILELSKIEAGKLQICLKAFELRPLLTTITDMFGPGLLERPVELKVECPDQVPAWLEGDQVRLRQILVNLVGNAVKYSEQGTVTLRTRYTSEGLEFDVEDQGTGIPASIHESLFEAFSQADSSLNRRHGGVGLGLSVVSRLIALLGGSIDFRTESGVGTTFFVKLPWRSCHGPTQSAGPSVDLDVDFSHLKVLVVEDNPINRKVLGLQLEKLGVGRIDYAENGEQALVAARERTDSLIILDCQMPGIDGIEVARRIRADAESYGTPIIVALTAHALANERERCLEAGMNEFLTKPLAFRALQETLALWGPQSIAMNQEGK